VPDCLTCSEDANGRRACFPTQSIYQIVKDQASLDLHLPTLQLLHDFESTRPLTGFAGRRRWSETTAWSTPDNRSSAAKSSMHQWQGRPPGATT